MGEAKDSAFWDVRETLDFPAVGEHDLLDDGQAEPRALLVGGEIRLEDFRALVVGNTGAVVADIE